MKDPIHILLIEGRYYNRLADALLQGAETALGEAGATWELATAPGALEIPQVLAAAIDAGAFDDSAAKPFHGAIALGCVIRGETTHYDIVANESARALMDLATQYALPVGNGILTVENEAQAVARASATGKNKGREAASACLEVLRAKREFGKRRR
ncbi:MAG: 6,7-dimethyl-8-ribityllumazine synthase [Rhodomicrobium sp.]